MFSVRKSDREPAGAAIESIHAEFQNHKSITNGWQIWQRGSFKKMQVRHDADLRARGSLRKKCKGKKDKNLCVSAHTQNMQGVLVARQDEGAKAAPLMRVFQCAKDGGMKSDGCEMIPSSRDPGL